MSMRTKRYGMGNRVRSRTSSSRLIDLSSRSAMLERSAGSPLRCSRTVASTRGRLPAG